jgi:hypothetical protein
LPDDKEVIFTQHLRREIMPIAPNKTLGYAKIDPDIYIYVSSTNKSPSNEDFTIYLQFLQQHLKTGEKARAIAYERFEGISAVQRKLLRDVIVPDSPVAVLTTSALARGIVTALSWFNKQFKAFSPEDRLSAFRHMGLQPSAADEVWKTIQNLANELDSSLPRQA